MKNKNALMFTAMLLVCVIAVGATIAYLTSTPAPVTNTFTVGNVDITLDETPVDEYGSPIPDATPTTENDYTLIPGHAYVKNPTVHVAAGSEPCYLFVKVVNGLQGLEATIPPTLEPGTSPQPGTSPRLDPSIAAQMERYGWKPLAGYTDIYYFYGVVDPSDDNPNKEYIHKEETDGYVINAKSEAQDIVVFQTVTIAGNVTFAENTPSPTDTTITTEVPTPLDTTITTDTPSPADTPAPRTYDIVVTSCAIQAMGFESAEAAYNEARPVGFYEEPVVPNTNLPVEPEQPNP